MVVNLWGYWCGPCREELPDPREVLRRPRRPGGDARHRLPATPRSTAPWRWWTKAGVTLPARRRPRRRPQRSGAVRAAIRGLPISVFVGRRTAPPRSVPVDIESRATSSSTSSSSISGSGCDRRDPSPRGSNRCAPAPRRSPADDLTRFLPPDDADPRRGAVLMLFADPVGDGLESATLLLTERAHHMRSHPGQVSFPGGSIDAGETAVAGRAARGRGGDRPRPCRRRGVRRAARAVAAAQQLRRHAGARLVAHPDGRCGWSTPTRCTPSTWCRSPSCCGPTTASTSATRRAGSGRRS